MKILRRNIEVQLMRSLGRSRAVCLLGARQTGKSTLVSEVSGKIGAELKSLDNPAERNLARQDPIGYLEDSPTPLIIDEVQRATGLLDAIKLRVDREKSYGQYLLTGSANLLNLKSVSDALPGRVQYLTLHPFTRGELAGVSETFLDRLFQSKPPFYQAKKSGKATYSSAITKGGYPEAQSFNDEDREAFFENYISSLLGRSLDGVSHPRDTARIHLLLEFVAARSGAIQNATALAGETGVSANTVRNDLALLANMFLVTNLRSWSRNLGNRLIKAPKVYLSDSGLLASLVGINGDNFLDHSGDIGMLFETFVVNELIRQNSWAKKPASFYYYRDTSQREVDLIAERPGGEVVAFEVKASSTVGPEDFRQIKFLKQKLGAKLRAGVVLYTGDKTIPAGERLTAMPIEAIWQDIKEP